MGSLMTLRSYRRRRRQRRGGSAAAGRGGSGSERNGKDKKADDAFLLPQVRLSRWQANAPSPTGGMHCFASTSRHPSGLVSANHLPRHFLLRQPSAWPRSSSVSSAVSQSNTHRSTSRNQSSSDAHAVVTILHVAHRLVNSKQCFLTDWVAAPGSEHHDGEGAPAHAFIQAPKPESLLVWRHACWHFTLRTAHVAHGSETSFQEALPTIPPQKSATAMGIKP